MVLVESRKTYQNVELSTVECIIKERIKETDLVKVKGQGNAGGGQVYNIPVAFDIETTSFYYNDMKCALMYVWMLGINGVVIMGRTWDEFMSVLQCIHNTLGLSSGKRIVIYVQNLEFEFQFIRKYFEWLDVFAIDERRPIRAISVDGFEFRCSYILSGMSLEKIGENLVKYKIEKMVGDLDYRLFRHHKTPLTPEEIKYCENDVHVVMSYIQEEIEKNGNIGRIPMTRTGYVRRKCKTNCMSASKKLGFTSTHNYKYKQLMKELTIEPAEYTMLVEAFEGGRVGANPFYSDAIIDNVSSNDRASAYPTECVAQLFPMSKGRFVHVNSKELFWHYVKTKCCLFTVEFINIKSTIDSFRPISAYHCIDRSNVDEENGHLISASRFKMTITEQDFLVYRKFYSWDKMRIGKFVIYEKGYLPVDLIKTILELYRDKTELKGVVGKEEEYLEAKGDLNSIYGMMVTAIVRDNTVYQDDEWDVSKANVDEQLTKHNDSWSRFLFYPWGVWITAYARRNLLAAIYELGDDFVYTDTDSVKYINAEKHAAWFEQANKNMRIKLETTCAYLGIDKSLLTPKTIKGVEKPLGAWECDGIYKKFKTLGAKRYMAWHDDNEMSLTVSGLNKVNALPFICSENDAIFTKDENNRFYVDDATAAEKCISFFRNTMTIDDEHTGKLTHTYIDEPISGEITDYLGETVSFETLSGIHLEECPFSLSLTDNYVDFLKMVKEGVVRFGKKN